MANNATRDAEQLIDLLYSMVDNAKNAPLTGGDKCIISRDEVLDLLEELRAALPAELQRAQDLIRAKDEYVETAKREVERMKQRAEADAKNKVSDSEVLFAARERSREIVRGAEERTNEMYRVATEYTEDMLRRTEEAIQSALEEIRERRAEFRTVSAEQLKKRREELKRATEKTDK